jgi:hypothetical protein
MPVDSSGPLDIRSVAITMSDLVAAIEMNETTGKRAVLRLTPPFHGRMRARLHVNHGDSYDGEPEPIHIEPETFLDSDAPSYPRPADTEDELRNQASEMYSVDRHREYHAEAVDSWRGAIQGAIRDEVTLKTRDGPTTVEVKRMDRSA